MTAASGLSRISCFNAPTKFRNSSTRASIQISQAIPAGPISRRTRAQVDSGRIRRSEPDWHPLPCGRGRTCGLERSESARAFPLPLRRPRSRCLWITRLRWLQTSSAVGASLFASPRSVQYRQGLPLPLRKDDGDRASAIAVHRRPYQSSSLATLCDTGTALTLLLQSAQSAARERIIQWRRGRRRPRVRESCRSE